MSNFFSRLFHLQKTEEKSAVEQFNELVRKVADGKEPKAEDAARILKDVGRTPAQLKDAVDLILRRRAAKATLDAAIAGEREVEMINAKLSALEAEHDKAIAKMELELGDKAHPMKQRLWLLATIVSAGGPARQLLAQTAEPDEGAERRLAERQQIGAQLNAVARPIQTAMLELQSEASKLQQLRDPSLGKFKCDPEDYAKQEAIVHEFQRRFDQLGQEKSALEAQLAELARHEQEIEEAKLKVA